MREEEGGKGGGEKRVVIFVPDTSRSRLHPCEPPVHPSMNPARSGA